MTLLTTSTTAVPSWILRFRFQGKVTSISNNLIGPDTKMIQLKQFLTNEKGRICYGIAPTQLRFRGGFPPRVIQLNDDDPISKNSLIRNKDMLHVELIDNNGNRIPIASPSSNNNKNNNNKRTTLSSSSSPSINNKNNNNGKKESIPFSRSTRERKPSERQYMLPPDEKKSNKRKRASSKKKTIGNNNSPFNKNNKKKVGVYTLNGGGSSSSSSGKKTSTKKKWRGMKWRGRRIGIAGEEDATAKLVSALTPGNSKDPIGQFFRFATKSAVRKQYDITRANNRFKSILLNEYEIKEDQNSRTLGDSSGNNESISVRLKVRFKKGPRSWEEEDVDAIPRDALKVLVLEILREQGDAGKELLKPHLMAEVSPRTFWSIVHFYGRDIPLALKTMCPGVDFKFLNERAKKFSEKALIHQQRMKEKEERARERLKKKLEREKKKLEKEARKDLEERNASNGNVGSSSSSSGNNNNNNDNTNDNDEKVTTTTTTITTTTTTTATDSATTNNNAKQPIIPASPSNNNNNNVSSPNVGKSSTIENPMLLFLKPDMIKVLSNACEINNIEELADGDVEEIFDDLEDSDDFDSSKITQDQVSAWVDRAREESLIYIMATLLNIETDHPLLTILASNGIIAPRDLSVYKAVDLHAKLKLDSVSVEDIENWRVKAWAILGKKPWLAEYFHMDNVQKN